MNLLPFRLVKTYMDFIDDDGNCFVAYRALLTWSLLKVRYSGVLFSTDTSTGESFYFRDTPQRNELELHLKKADFFGIWKPEQQGMTEILYASGEKKILWNCMHPNCQVDVIFRGRSYMGRGYMETLDLPLKPWQIPLHTLRWGRFLAGDISIVWIQWEGSHPVNKLYFNGALFTDIIYHENEINFNGGKNKLTFVDPTIIRKGKLSGSLDKAPWLKHLFSKRILDTMETKYKSRCTFDTESSGPISGWALYEVVTWPSETSQVK